MKYFVIIVCAFLCVFLSCNKEEYVTPAPKIYYKNSGKVEVLPLDTIVLSPKITYDYDSEYWWELDGEIVCTDLEYEFIPQTMRDYYFTFSVTNEQGCDTFNIEVSCLKTISCAEFDNFVKPKKSALYLLPDTLQNWIVDTIAVFNNQINEDTTAWYGFCFSSFTTNNTATVSTDDIGKAYINSSSTSSDYMCGNCNNGYCLPMVTFDKDYVVKSLQVANDNFVYQLSRFGATFYLYTDTILTDTLTIPYMNYGDYLTLLISGMDKNNSITGTVRYNLVDCADTLSTRFTRVTEWETVDLKELGPVYGLYFDYECSRGEYPVYFCLDNIKLQD